MKESSKDKPEYILYRVIAEFRFPGRIGSLAGSTRNLPLSSSLLTHCTSKPEILIYAITLSKELQSGITDLKLHDPLELYTWNTTGN